MLKVLCQNYICSYPNYLLPQTNHTYLKYFINIQIFVVPFLFIYTYMRIGEPISRHAHTCIWKETFMPSTHSWGAIPHHIFIWEAFSCHLWHRHTHFFFERLLMLFIHKYTYFEMHYLLFIHFVRHFCYIYLHIYLHIIDKHPPRYLGAKCQSCGQLKSL